MAYISDEVYLRPVGTRPQCPDDAAILTLRRNQDKAITINDKSRALAGSAGHCGDLRKPEGLSGRWQVWRRRSCRSPAADTGRGPCAF